MNRSPKKLVLTLLPLAVSVLLVLLAYPFATRHAARQRTYRIGADNAPPYYILHPDGRIDGMAFEIMEAAAHEAGVHLRWIPLHKTPDDALAAGDVDLWPGLAGTPERLRLYTVTVPWLRNDTVAVMLSSGQPLDTQTINSSTVAMRGKSLLLPQFHAMFPGALINPTATREDALISVCTGATQIGIMETRFLQAKLFHRLPECANANFSTHTITPMRAELSIIARRDAGLGATLLREGINAVAQSGRFDQMLEKWDAYTSADGANLVNLQEAEHKNSLAAAAICIFLALSSVLGWQYYRVLAAERNARSAQQAAEAANSLKSRFLANMSHEIRTPMNGILGFADLGLQSRSFEEQRDCLETIRSSGSALLAILNDLLDLSKIEAERFQLSIAPFSLRGLLTDAGKVFAFRFREKGLVFKSSVSEDLPDFLMGDELRLRQVLLNLLGNAVKFTSEGSIELNASGEQAGDKVNLRLSIRDSGIGIPPDKQALVFEAFRQADDSTSKKYGGTGLGLSICMRLVDMMGGKIELESAVGQGSCFSVNIALPLATEEFRLPDQAAQASAQPVSRPLRILLAEDNLVNQKLAVKLLQKAGHSVTVAGNGLLAIQAYTNTTFDLILMDVQMPEMDGLDATREIRKLEPPGIRIPIIALTAQTMSGDRENCLAAGMDGFASKPIRLAELFNEINAIARSLPKTLADRPAA